jgi:flagellar biosynthesis component FlhA
VVVVGRADEDADSARELLERLHDPARVLALSDGVFAIFAAMPVLYFLDITVLRSGRQRNQE